MAEKQLAIMDPDDKENFVYYKDTVQIHTVSAKFESRSASVYSMEEFSLLDDESIKCRPQVWCTWKPPAQCSFVIEFTTPVPKANKYKISLYYFDKLRQLKLSDVLNAENIEQGNKYFTLSCNEAFEVNNRIAANSSDGIIILCSKICRQDTLYVSQKKPAHLYFSQITDCSLLFENTALSNLAISVENREFKVHKEILAAKSSVFLAMFETDMKERRENHVKIEDIEANIFQEFLRYIYTNTVNDLNTHAEKLYAAADKYDLPKLKSICIDELSRSLNAENARHMFLFADENNLTILKERTMEFIRKHIKLIFQTEDDKALCQSPKAYYIIDEIFQATVDYFDALK